MLKVTLLLASAIIVGCSPLAPLPNQTKFFMLSPIAENGASKTNGALNQQVSIGVGPIDFPDYLKRYEIVTRTAANRIDVSGENRWAGPLDKNFTRVLSQNLGDLLETQRVQSYPWSRSAAVDYQVVVEVEEFDTSSDKQANLNARWSIRDGLTGKDLYATRTTATTPVGAGQEGPSAALSSNLAVLSREIASQVTLINQQRPKVRLGSNGAIPYLFGAETADVGTDLYTSVTSDYAKGNNKLSEKSTK
jgi:uncharacterized protein